MSVTALTLKIISPEGTLFFGVVSTVKLPGVMGTFTVLPQHAPIISVLDKGVVVYEVQGETKEQPVQSGFVEVINNEVTVCVEI